MTKEQDLSNWGMTWSFARGNDMGNDIVLLHHDARARENNVVKRCGVTEGIFCDILAWKS